MTDVDRVFLEGLVTRCVIGVWPRERRTAQRLELDVWLERPLWESAATGALTATTDYSLLAIVLGGLLRFGRYRLLESAAEDLAAAALAVDPGASAVGLRLRKPAALPGRASAAGVEVRRGRVGGVARPPASTPDVALAVVESASDIAALEATWGPAAAACSWALRPAERGPGLVERLAPLGAQAQATAGAPRVLVAICRGDASSP